MSAINYTSRFKKAVFCEKDIKNSAKRAMLFVNFEYRAGGEPVFRSTEVNVRKNLRGSKFIWGMRSAATRKRLLVRRKTGVSVSLPIKIRLKMKARKQKVAPSRNSTAVSWV